MNKDVLILTTPFRPNVGGVETHLDDLITIGSKKGFHFTVITYQPLVTKARGKTIEIKKGYTIFRVPWIRMNLFLILERFPVLEFIYLVPGIWLFSFLYLLKNGKSISTIHAQGLVAGVVGVFLGRIFNKKTIISTHSIYKFPHSGFYPMFIKTVFNMSDHILTLSLQSKNEIENLGVKADKISIFTYWVDQNIFRKKDKNQSRKRIGMNENEFAVLFVGRLVKVKGVMELLKAAERTDDNITFYIIGDGPLSETVRRYAGKFGNIRFVGKVNNRDLPDYYNSANVLIVPSVHEEGFGRVILEALSCGLPVIGANRGGIKECLTNDVGMLIDVSPYSIRKAVERFYKNKLMLLKMGVNSVRYSAENFSNKNINQIVKYYEK